MRGCVCGCVYEFHKQIKCYITHSQYSELRCFLLLLLLCDSRLFIVFCAAVISTLPLAFVPFLFWPIYFVVVLTKQNTDKKGFRLHLHGKHRLACIHNHSNVRSLSLSLEQLSTPKTKKQKSSVRKKKSTKITTVSAIAYNFQQTINTSTTLF